MYETILYEVTDPVAVVTINRPDSLNAFTDEVGSELRDAMSRANADPAVVGVVLTGAGRAFCAGADMKLLAGMASGDPDVSGAAAAAPAGAHGDDDLGGRFGYLMGLDKPVIAAINGPVAGMAYPLALCCDIRVASTEALLVTSFAQRGLIAEWGLSWLLPRQIGPSAALDLLFTSRKVGADEALRLGLVDHVVEPGELLGFCRRYVEQIAMACSPTSLAVMKRQVYSRFHAGLGAAEQEAVELMQESFGRPDFAEGVASFLEKRPPRFARLGSM